MAYKYAWRHVANVMTRDVLTLTEADSAKEAALLMVQYDISCIVIVDAEGARKRVKGILSEHDLLRLLASHTDPVKVRLREIMHPDPVIISPGEDFMVASTVMEQHNIKRLPVVEAGYLVGILTQSDIAHALNELNKYSSSRLVSLDAAIGNPMSVPSTHVTHVPVRQQGKVGKGKK